MVFAASVAAVALGACRLFVDLDGLDDGPALTDGAADRAVVDAPFVPVDGGGMDTSVLDSAKLDAPIDADADAGPPIVFVSASKVDPLQNVSAIDLPKPNGVLADDVVLVGLFTDIAATNVQTPANFTKLSDLAVPSPADIHGWWYVHVIGNAEPPKTTFTLDSASPYVSAVALAYRHVRPGSPIDVAAYGASTGTAYIAPTVTTTVPRTVLVSMHLADDTTSAVWTPPTGATVRAVTGICAAFQQPFASPGATGPIVATSDQNAGAANALFALAPAP